MMPPIHTNSYFFQIVLRTVEPFSWNAEGRRLISQSVRRASFQMLRAKCKIPNDTYTTRTLSQNNSFSTHFRSNCSFILIVMYYTLEIYMHWIQSIHYSCSHFLQANQKCLIQRGLQVKHPLRPTRKGGWARRTNLTKKMKRFVLLSL